MFFSSFGDSCPYENGKDKKEKTMYKKYEMELAGRTLRVDVGRVAKQANGAVLMHYGDTTVLCTATASEKPREGIDFFPLSVEYNERLYAVGKIPGGFNKREGKASENAILTDRVIDRPMRPLFPKDYRNDVTLENLVLSVDQDCSPELTAMLGAAIAVSISDIPFDGPISTTQVGLVDGQFVFNPTAAQKDVSDLALTVASTREKVIMIEAGANEVPEAQMIDAIFAAHEVNQKVISFIDTIVAECGKPKHEYESCAVPAELFDAIKEIVPPVDLDIHLDRCDSFVGAGHLEIHITEEIFQSLNICQDKIIVVCISRHKSRRNSCHSRFDRYTRRHQRHTGCTHTGLRRGAVRLKSLRNSADRIGEFFLIRQHRKKRPLCQSAMADLAASRSSGRPRLSYRVGREVIMVHISLGCLRLIQAVQPLRLGKGSQSCDCTDLSLPSCKHCGTVNSRDQIHFCCKRSDLVNGASVRALMIF